MSTQPPGPRPQPGRPGDWETTYQTSVVEEMPWFYEALDPDVERALARLGIRGGRFLDIGTGPGTQAIAMATRGFDATGTDLSKTAVAKAAARAESRGTKVAFVVDDILSSRLDGKYDVLLDRGCFHVIAPEQRSVYVDAVAKLVAPGGHLFLKTFSAKQPGEWGPFRFAPETLRSLFEVRFDVLSLDESTYYGALRPDPLALFAVLRTK